MAKRGVGAGVGAVVAVVLLVALPALGASAGSAHRPSGKGCVKLGDEIARANDVFHDFWITLDPDCPPQRDLALVVKANGGRTVTIQGHGATLGGGSDSLFRVLSGAHLTLQQITFSGSKAGVVESEGGYVVVEGSTFSDNRGGAIEEASAGGSGRLTISDSTFERNQAGEGGAILSDEGDITITHSTFAGNVAADGDGGAILIDDGSLSVTNSTFSGNVAARGGGALASVESGVILTNVTVWGNEGDSSGGVTGPVTAVNTLVAGNSPSNCGATALVEGRREGGPDNNLSDGQDCGSSFVAAASAGIDPSLDVHGGSTATHALLPGSAAVDAGSNALCPSTDQRGVRRARTDGDACDIGAFEGTSEEPPPPPPPPAPSPFPVNQPPIAANGVESVVAGGSPLALDLARLAVDAETSDGDLLYALAGAKPRAGAASLVGSVVVYTTGQDARGRDTIRYRVTDGGNPDGCVGSSAACAPARSASGVIRITITSAPSPSPSPGVGPDLTLEDVRLELVAGGSARGRRVSHYAAGPEWRDQLASGLRAADADSLHVRGRVLNKGDQPSTPTTLAVATADWEADPITVPAVDPGDSTDIDELIPAPPGVDDDTKFTVTLAAVEGEANAGDNVKTDVLAVRDAGGSSTKTIVLVLVTVVVAAGAAIGASALTNMIRKPPTNTPSQGQQPGGGAGLPFDGLEQLADLYLGAEAGPALWSVGKESTALKDLLGREDAASRVIGTLFWRALMASRQFDDVLRDAGASDSARLHPDLIVVPHAGGTRFDLVVFDPLFAGAEPIGVPLDPDVDDLVAGWRLVTSNAAGGDGSPLGSLHASLSSVLTEVARSTTFHLAVAAKPEIALTNAPSPPWPVAGEDEEPTSTAGVVAIDALGRKGVTVADHAVRGREKVLVDGRLGTIVSSDPISDSSFVEVEVGDPVGDAARGAKGPLSGVSPRQMEVAEFDGMRSGKTTTRVTGWDPTILTTESFIQTKIVTEPVTMPGDSGAALVDGDGHILGFAFYTTGLNAQPAHSGWIWAESVYRAHGLRPWVEGEP